jgi:hypothetical protein
LDDSSRFLAETAPVVDLIVAKLGRERVLKSVPEARSNCPPNDNILESPWLLLSCRILLENIMRGCIDTTMHRTKTLSTPNPHAEDRATAIATDVVRKSHCERKSISRRSELLYARRNFSP